MRARTFLAATLLTLLFAESLRAFFSATYYHNLTTLGLNASALVVLLALSPLVLLAARPAWLLPASVATLAAARIGMSLTWGGVLYLPLAGLAVAAALLALPLLAWRGDLAADAKREGADGPASTPSAEVAMGFALAWALDAALAYLNGSFDPTARLQGLYLAAPAGLGALALVWPERHVSSLPARRGLLAGASIGAWIFLEHAILASPSAMARWDTVPTVALAFLSILGLALPLVIWYKVQPPRWIVIGANAALVVALLDHTFLHTGWLLLVALLPAQAALAIDLALVLPKAGAGAWALGAGVMLIFHFGVALSLTFAYVPPSALWKGSELWLIPLAGALAIAPALLALRRSAPRASTAGASAPAKGWRNLPALIIVAALMLAALGAASPRAAITEPAPGSPIRVLTFNLHQGFDNSGVVDPDDFVQVLVETSPELVALQESDTARVTSANLDMVGYLASHTGYHALYGPPTRAESFGVSMLSRYPISESHVVMLPSSKDNRYFIEARVNVSGNDVWFYVVHLGLPAQDREDETAVLLQHVESRKGPQIIAGDFNSCPHVVCPDYDGRMDTVYDTMAAKYVDTYKATAPSHNESDPAAYTYDAGNLTHRIDYVWVTPDFIVHDAQSVTSAAAIHGSDHVPVLATLELA